MNEKLGQAIYKGKRGMLIATEDGLSHIPFKPDPDNPDIRGEAFSLPAAGIFGAINLMNKLNDFEESLDENAIALIEWNKISDAKKLRWKGTIEIYLKDGEIVKILDTSSWESIRNFVS